MYVYEKLHMSASKQAKEFEIIQLRIEVRWLDLIRSQVCCPDRSKVHKVTEFVAGMFR